MYTTVNKQTNTYSLIFSNMTHPSPADLVRSTCGVPLKYSEIFDTFSKYPQYMQTSGYFAWHIADYLYNKNLEEYVQGEEIHELNVYMSSTFAAAMKVCHDYSYFYLDEDEYSYAEGRGGSWTLNYSLHDVFTYLDRIHTIRKIARNNIYNILSVCKFTVLPTDQKLEILTFM